MPRHIGSIYSIIALIIQTDATAKKGETILYSIVDTVPWPHQRRLQPCPQSCLLPPWRCPWHLQQHPWPCQPGHCPTIHSPCYLRSKVQYLMLHCKGLFRKVAEYSCGKAYTFFAFMKRTTALPCPQPSRLGPLLIPWRLRQRPWPYLRPCQPAFRRPAPDGELRANGTCKAAFNIC